MELSRQPGAALGQLSPIVCHSGLLGIAIPQHDGQLARRQARAGSCVLGHQVKRPWESRLVQGRSPARHTSSLSAVPARFRKTKTAPLRAVLAAFGGTPPPAIDTFAKIDRLGRKQNPALRSELHNISGSQKARTSAASGNWGSQQ